MEVGVIFINLLLLINFSVCLSVIFIGVVSVRVLFLFEVCILVSFLFFNGFMVKLFEWL